MNWSPWSGSGSARWPRSAGSTVVPALPKTRSGKILRRTMRGLVEGRDEPVPATIDDPATLAVFRGLGGSAD